MKYKHLKNTNKDYISLLPLKVAIKIKNLTECSKKWYLNSPFVKRSPNDLTAWNKYLKIISHLHLIGATCEPSSAGVLLGFIHGKCLPCNFSGLSAIGNGVQLCVYPCHNQQSAGRQWPDETCLGQIFKDCTRVVYSGSDCTSLRSSGEEPYQFADYYVTPDLIKNKIINKLLVIESLSYVRQV